MDTIFLTFIIVQTIAFLVLVLILLQSSQKTTKSLIAASTEQIAKILNEKKAEKKTEGFKLILPLKVQASERLVLFLERIQPSALLARHFGMTTTSAELNKLVLNAIREEFEHNLSQQLFVSETAWQLTKAAREEVIQVFHVAFSNLPEGASSLDLAREMIGAEVKLIEPAIRKIREDLNKNT